MHEAADAPAEAAPEPAPPSAPGSAERRHITALAAELLPATAALPADPEELLALVDVWRRYAGAVLARHGGVPAESRTREVIAWFGYPVAQESAAERAVRAGLALTAHFVEGDAALPEGYAVRVGVASGLVVARPAGEILGETPATAARLLTLAEPGEVVAAAGTRRLAGDLFDYRARGPAWQVIGASAHGSRSEARHAAATAPLIGREEELDHLLRTWRQAASAGGRLVLLSGEPGIGKSRLLAAFEEALAEAPHRSLRYFCSPLHRESALHPVIVRWQQEAGFAYDDTAAAQLAKLHALLAPAALAPEDVALIAAMLSLPADAAALPQDFSPQRRKERIFAALLRRLTYLARDLPVLLLFEDAHWADPSSLELLDALIESLAELPVLLVVSHRPEFTPAWVGRPGASVLALSRLTPRQSAALAGQCDGTGRLGPEVLEGIVRRTDGVPLFIEELTRALLDDATAPRLTVPASLQDLLMARLDRVPAGRKVAQIGAAIGRGFAHDLLAAVAELPAPALAQGVAELVQAGLLLARGTPPQVSYSFKHALVQDTAYGSLLRPERQRLHGRIVGALEGRHETTSDLLAHHATEAGLTDRAVSWWLRAGTASLARGAVAEALAQLDRGLALIPALPEDATRHRLELDLRLARSKALMAAEGHATPSLGAELDRAQALCVALDATGPLSAVLFGRWTHAFVRGEFALAHAHAGDLLASGETRQDAVLTLLGHYTRGLTALPRGAFGEAARNLRRVFDLFDAARRADYAIPTGVADPRVVSRLYLAWGCLCEGRFAVCRQESATAVEEARSLGQPWTLAQALSISAFFALTLDGPEAGLRWLAELLPLATEHRFLYFVAMAAAQRSWCLAAQGAPEQGATLLRRGIEPLRKAGSLLWIPSLLAAEAEALGRMGQGAAAGGRLDEAIGLAETTGAYWDMAEMHRVRSTLLTAAGDTAGAEAALLRACDLAAQQGARLFALRAATALARLHDGGERRASLLRPALTGVDAAEAGADLDRARALRDAAPAGAAVP